MKICKYEDVTIDQLNNLIKLGQITELTCDGDSKSIYVKEEEYIKSKAVVDEIIKSIKNAIEPVVDAVVEVFSTVATSAEAFAKALMSAADIMIKEFGNKKMTKNKFKKMLQSQGIQRNEINKIIENFNQNYTYRNYINLVNEYNKKISKRKKR